MSCRREDCVTRNPDRIIVEIGWLGRTLPAVRKRSREGRFAPGVAHVGHATRPLDRARPAVTPPLLKVHTCGGRGCGREWGTKREAGMVPPSALLPRRAVAISGMRPTIVIARDRRPGARARQAAGPRCAP